MESIRSFLGKGQYRYHEMCVISIFYVAAWGYFDFHEATACTFFKVVSALLTALSVVAYNLRNKLLDFIISRISVSSNYKQIASETNKNLQGLTGFILLSFTSALICVLAGFWVNQLLFLIAGIMFIMNLVSYVHILFAFDMLEKEVIADAVHKRDISEKELTLKHLDRDKEKYPDNYQK